MNTIPCDLFGLISRFLSVKKINYDIGDFRLSSRTIFKILEETMHFRARLITTRISKIFNNDYYLSNNNINIVWVVPNESICINRKFKLPLIIKIGDFVSCKSRDTGFKIINFTGREDASGPIGIIYLPWRSEQQKWATPLFTLRGDPRHIICYPCGIPHFGQHEPFNSFELLNNGICPDVVN